MDRSQFMDCRDKKALEFEGKFPVLLSENCREFGFDEGWNDLVLNTLQKLNDLMVESGCRIRVDQVKEKFGALRVYHECDDQVRDQVWEIIALAEKESEKICEICGKPGELKTDQHWWITVCKEHEKR